MTSIQTIEFLRFLKVGDIDAAEASGMIDHLSAGAFIDDASVHYPITFQERQIGRKHEIGLARRLRFELATRRRPARLFAPVILQPALLSCLFISSYSGRLSGVSIMSSLRVFGPGRAAGGLRFRSGPGRKLDRGPDGWSIQDLGRATTRLTEEFLLKRGWKFDALRP